MLIFLALLHSLFFSPQQIRIPGPGGQLPSGGGVIGTPVGSECVSQTAGACLTNTQTTTAGDAILYTASAANSGCSGSMAPLLPTDTGSDTFNPVPISSGGVVLGAIVPVGGGGAGYTGPTCAMSGPGPGGGTCAVSLSGGVVVGVTVTNGGNYTGAVTFALGGTTGTGASAFVSGYGQPSSTSFCQAAWLAANVAGTANNQITMPTAFSGLTFNAGSAVEVSGLSTSAPLDTASGARAASGGSITTGTFNTANANEIVVCPTRVEALTNTWTYGNIGGVASAVVSGSTGASPNNFQTVEYKTFTSTQSGITGAISSTPSGERTMICVALTH